MLLILLKSSACLAAFMLFYKLCLEKTSAHIFKRIYLIAVIFISISIPFIVFTEYIEIAPANVTVIPDFHGLEINNSIESKSFLDYTPTLFWSIYVLGVLLFSFRFLKNLYQIFQKIKVNPKYKNHNYINVLLNDLIHPHTFFNYIFLNKNKYEHNLIPTEVLLHEQVHAKQKHAIDILFIEVLQIAFWFNPLLYFIKKDIKLNHEFLADQAVINNGANTKHYQQLLLAFSSNASHNQLANAINYSLIKKRFTVMKTQTSQKIIWVRSLIILPLLAVLIFSFSSKHYIEKDNASNEILIQQKATPEQIAEYNRLAKKYNAQPQNKRVIKLKDVNRLEYLYNLMSKKQQANAEPFPNCPPPPPAPPKAKKGKLLDSPQPPLPPKPQKTGFIDINEDVHFYSTNNGTTKYYDSLGLEVDKKGHKLSTKQTDGSKVVNGQNITKVYRNNKVVSKFEKTWDEDEEIHEIEHLPAPKPPLDQVVEMAKKGATFYYNGKKVSSDSAIELLKNNKSLNISSKTNDGVSVVNIQTDPIRL